MREREAQLPLILTFYLICLTISLFVQVEAYYQQQADYAIFSCIYCRYKVGYCLDPPPIRCLCLAILHDVSITWTVHPVTPSVEMLQHRFFGINLYEWHVSSTCLLFSPMTENVFSKKQGWKYNFTSKIFSFFLKVQCLLKTFLLPNYSPKKPNMIKRWQSKF